MASTEQLDEALRLARELDATPTRYNTEREQTFAHALLFWHQRCLDAEDEVEFEHGRFEKAEAEHNNERGLLKASLRDALSFAVRISRNEGAWENEAKGLIARIDGALGERNQDG